MYSDLSHLNSKQIDTLMSRYYSGEDLEFLLSWYGLEFSNTVYELFPEEVSGDICEKCNNFIMHKFLNRKSILTDREDYCPVCGTKVFRDFFNIERSVYELEELRLTGDFPVSDIRKQVLARYDVYYDLIDFNVLPINDKINLAALFAYSDKSAFPSVAPLFRSFYGNFFSADKDCSDAFLTDLVVKKLLFVDPYTPFVSFMSHGRLCLDKPDYLKTKFYAPFKSVGLDYDYITNPGAWKFSGDEITSIYKIWRNFFVLQCSSYFLFKLFTLGIGIAAGTTRFIMPMLSSFFDEVLSSRSLHEAVSALSYIFLNDYYKIKYLCSAVNRTRNEENLDALKTFLDISFEKFFLDDSALKYPSDIVPQGFFDGGIFVDFFFRVFVNLDINVLWEKPNFGVGANQDFYQFSLAVL